MQVFSARDARLGHNTQAEDEHMCYKQFLDTSLAEHRMLCPSEQCRSRLVGSEEAN